MRSAQFQIPFKNTKNQFTSRMFTNQNPTHPSTTVQIPIEQSNASLAKVMQEQQQEQDHSKKSKWYQNKKWEYPGILAAGTATGITVENVHADFEPDHEKKAQEMDQINRLLQERYLKSEDTQKIAPKLYALFLKIKNDLGITENIELRIEKFQDNSVITADATYLPQYNCILIKEYYTEWNSIDLIRVLAHELEHAKQALHYFGSYKLSSLQDYQTSQIEGIESETGTHLKAETGADASAAGYFDCPKCLQEIAKNLKESDHPLLQYHPQGLPSGHFTTKLGYFAPQDYDSYIERACKDGELCEAHTLLGKPKKIGYPKNVLESMKFDPHFAQQYNKDYLAQKYNEQRLQLEYSMPTELFLPKSA